MKNFWKWIIGIVVVLVIIGALVAIPLVMRSNMLAFRLQNNLPQSRGFYYGPMMRGDDGFGWMHPQMRGFNRGFGGRLGFFGFGFGLFGLAFRLIPLVLLGLLLFGIYQLGKRSGQRSVMPPAAPAAAAPPQSEAPASEPDQPAAP